MVNRKTVESDSTVFEKRQDFFLSSLRKESNDPENAHKIVQERKVSDLRLSREIREIDIEELLRKFNGPQAK